VPFYVRWPGHFSAGGVKRHLVFHVDITATAYDAAGVVPLHDLDGYSLLGSHRRHRLLTEMLITAKRIPPWSSLLTASGDDYIEYRTGDEVLFRELYELAEDPWELRNIAPKRPGKRAQLSALLSADRHCAGAACP
jgi:arylsulfatase A-like enzyme